MYLLDTNIVSADAPAKRKVDAEAFAAWVREHCDELYISTVTIAEIEAGIARSERIGATAKAERLRRWLAAVEHFYAGRILPFGIEEARHAGAILDRARAHDPGFEDIAIAATAAARGLTVLTANDRHFAPLGVPHDNPLKRLPGGRRGLHRGVPFPMAFTATVASTATKPSMPVRAWGSRTLARRTQPKS